ncbi:MAG TPA: glutamine--fructose-6-phosphate transaminase (isomerizing), partial [Bacteroidia bacterium]|nr:glutamine--fructose-6-phosphate transaminase (isomerizing) [Bacteroidia bacterium]
IGYREAYPILINGLKRLEYRGYDSAGVALLNGDLNVYKIKGKVADLENFAGQKELSGNIGMGHTRWATHGVPNDVNAHPHLSNSRNFAIIHNGIIENYSSIKKELISRGYAFSSDTDTEVLVQLIEDIYINSKVSADEAVRLALNKVVGAYGIVVICKSEPNQLIAARKGSPIVIGIGEREYFVASDATPLVEFTKEVIYLGEEEVAVIKNHVIVIKTIQNVVTTPHVETLEMELEALEKGGYDHFMLKEIMEQPRSIADSMRGRFNIETGEVTLGGLASVKDKLRDARRLLIVACGTSWHAGLVAEYLFEEYDRIPVEVEYASEFRYRNPVIFPDDVVIAISQSGETADTLAAIRLAKEKGATVLGVCNVVGSSIPRETEAGVYLHAGPEIGVASTKAFTSQVTVLMLMALYIGQLKGTVAKGRNTLVKGLAEIPAQVEKILLQNDKIVEIAKLFTDATNFLYLGRGYNFPVALEGALKLKEISYIHAEGYPAAEMKHGPIALIDQNMPVVFIAPNDHTHDKVITNIQEVKARKGRVIAIVSEGDQEIKNMAEFVIEIPQTSDALQPLLSVIPLQLLSYHIAVMRGCNVDQPRNLAKSVTVE